MPGPNRYGSVRSSCRMRVLGCTKRDLGTTKPGGSGLGLAVVQRAIEAHRGLVFVDSNTQGTRFTIVLPRTQPATAATPATPTAAIPAIRPIYATRSAS